MGWLNARIKLPFVTVFVSFHPTNFHFSIDCVEDKPIRWMARDHCLDVASSHACYSLTPAMGKLLFWCGFKQLTLKDEFSNIFYIVSNRRIISNVMEKVAICWHKEWKKILKYLRFHCSNPALNEIFLTFPARIILMFSVPLRIYEAWKDFEFNISPQSFPNEWWRSNHVY